MVAAAAALAAPYVARVLVGITGRIPPLSDLTGGEPLQVSQVASITPYLVGGAMMGRLARGASSYPSRQFDTWAEAEAYLDEED